MNTAYKIAIIGGGASGVSVFSEMIRQLVSQPYQKIEIDLYEKNDRFGTGIAYETNIDAHILNMPANTMSAIAEKPQDFFEWVRKNKEKTLSSFFNGNSKATDFLPREVFGLYLKNLFEKTFHKAKSNGITVNRIQSEITDIDRLSKTLLKLKSDKSTKSYNTVFMCLGNPPSDLYTHLKSAPGYLHQPWPSQIVEDGIPKQEPVFVIGSSLSALDTFITLKESGHTSSVTFISRHGMLPAVRVLSEPYELKYLSEENLKKLTNNGKYPLTFKNTASLMELEFRNAGIKKSQLLPLDRLNLNDPTAILKTDIENAKNNQNRYFSVLKAIDDVSGSIWSSMRIEARQLFDSHYKTIWNAIDYPMPMQNAKKLLSALEDKSLNIQSGLENIEYDFFKKNFSITCRNPRTNDIKTFKTNFVINATGRGLNINKMQLPLIKNALRKGFITPHVLGGIDVDFQTGKTRNSYGNFSENLYVVGALTRGVHFYTNSMQENAKAGKKAVDDMITKLQVLSNSQNNNIINEGASNDLN